MTTEVFATLYLLTLREVMQRTGLSRSALYYRFDKNSSRFDPSFPRPIRLGSASNSIRFISSELDAWIEQCITESRAEDAK